MPKNQHHSTARKPAARPLVINKLEKVSKGVFRQYYGAITELIGHSPGVYALYDGDELYYVGKSTELRSRVKQHLRDRHLASWTHFSLFLVRKAEHIQEIESLLVRIAYPKGNRAVPKGLSGGTLRKALKALVIAKQRAELDELFGNSRTHPTRPREKSRLHSLVGMVSRRTPLHRAYKGREYDATLSPKGTITFGKKEYASPSAAAMAIVKKSVNGWSFWYIEDLNGDWIKLNRYKA